MAQIYHYDREGVYTGVSAADPSPLEPGKYLIPACSTIKAPPLHDPFTHRARYVNGDWIIERLPPEPEPEPEPEPQLQPNWSQWRTDSLPFFLPLLGAIRETSPDIAVVLPAHFATAPESLDSLVALWNQAIAPIQVAPFAENFAALRKIMEDHLIPLSIDNSGVLVRVVR